ncbi:MAG: SsrA-binding protein SmpB [Patescibacteria group bacterium]|jgi:SsrA-binding protein
MKALAENKKAFFDYELLEKIEAGLVLYGHEVKSIKTGHVSLKGSYVTFKLSSKPGKLPEAYLINAHIPLYKFSNQKLPHDPLRSRKLLIKKSEIKHLMGKKQEQGLTLVPLKIYTVRGLIKLEFALAKGRKKHDKREVIKKRELDRKIRTLTRNK